MEFNSGMQFVNAHHEYENLRKLWIFVIGPTDTFLKLVWKLKCVFFKTMVDNIGYNVHLKQLLNLNIYIITGNAVCIQFSPFQCTTGNVIKEDPNFSRFCFP